MISGDYNVNPGAAKNQHVNDSARLAERRGKQRFMLKDANAEGQQQTVKYFTAAAMTYTWKQIDQQT